MNRVASKPRKRDPQATRQKILEAAKQLLSEGDGAVEMSWVAKAAGVSQGLAYHYFDSKEGLLGAVVNEFYDRVEDAVLMARLEQISDWETREKTRVRQYIEFLVEDPMAKAVITQLSGSPSVAAVETHRWQKLIDAGSKNMADGQKRGFISAEVNPTLLAALTLGAVRSAIASQLSTTNQIKPEELTRTIWQYVRRGIGLENENAN